MHFLQLRDTSLRLGFRSKQAALLLRGNDTREGWSSANVASEVWTPRFSDEEAWGTDQIITDSDNMAALAAWIED